MKLNFTIMAIVTIVAVGVLSPVQSHAHMSIQSSFGSFSCGSNCSGATDPGKAPGDEWAEDDDSSAIGMKAPKRAAIRDDDSGEITVSFPRK